MQSLFYLPWAIWFVSWCWLLVDCLRRDEFPPLVRSATGNRLLWLATFALFDPLLTLVYLVLVKFGWGRRRRWTAIPAYLALVLAAVGWWDAWTMPRTLAATRGADGAWERAGARPEWEATTHFSTASTSSSLVTTSSRGALLPARHVQILVTDDGPGAAGLARAIAGELMNLPFADRVDVGTASRFPAGERAPDLRVRVSGEEGARWLAAHRFSPSSAAPWHGQLAVRAPGWRSSGVVSMVGPAPLMRPELSILGSVASLHVGFASPTERALDLAAPLRDGLDSYFAELRRQAAMSRPLDSLPESFWGTYREPLELAFLDRVGARRMLSESDVFVHAKTVWIFEMPGWDEYERIRAELRDAGFANESSGARDESPDTQMARGEHWISIAPSDVRLGEQFVTRTSNGITEKEVIPPKIAGVRFHAHLEERFSEERRRTLLREAIAAGHLDLGMAMHGELADADLPGLLDALDDYSIENPFEAIVRANIAWRAENDEAATAWLRRAVALTPPIRQHPAGQAFDEQLTALSEKLEVELGELAPMTRADYVAAGYVDLGAEEAGAEAELGVGGMLWFVWGPGDEVVKGQLIVTYGDEGQLDVVVAISDLARVISCPAEVGASSEELFSASGHAFRLRLTRVQSNRLRARIE